MIGPPVRSYAACRKVDFMLRGINQRGLDMVEVFRRRVMDDWAGIGAGRRAYCEQRRDAEHLYYRKHLLSQTSSDDFRT
jgi:hypothetical protein